jgi:hypothetical protein
MATPYEYELMIAMLGSLAQPGPPIRTSPPTYIRLQDQRFRCVSYTRGNPEQVANTVLQLETTWETRNSNEWRNTWDICKPIFP